MNQEHKTVEKRIDDLEVKVDQVFEMTRKIRKAQLVAGAYSILKLLIIVLPLLYAFWYFSPQIDTIVGTWQQFVENGAQFSAESYFNPNEEVQRLLEEYAQQTGGQ